MRMTIEDLKKLNIPDQFGGDDEEYGDTLQPVIDQIKCEFAYGISKFVIFINDFTVAKIPFNGEFSWNCETNEYDFEEFHEILDYCEHEAYIYECAKNRGIEEFFAKTEFAGYTQDKTPFYLSERINTTLDDMWDKIDEESIRTAREYADTKKDFYWRRLSDRWLAVALKKYGKEKVDKFLDFINEFDVNDLHSANVGFRNNGDPVLIDYSGWCHEFSW